MLLHGESATPEQLFPLADAIKQVFPLAVLVLPHLNSHNDAAGVMHAVPALIQEVRQLQAEHGLSGAQTALAGFSLGASLALEASQTQPDLAGRILAFSGLYVRRPGNISSATMVHFFHGAQDAQIPAATIDDTLNHLTSLESDVTVDVATEIGHELHPALIQQAMVRLQTCVPLRNWDAALSELEAQARAQEQALPHSDGGAGPTLH
ncbi:MAG TPA: alpha/beta hydrolase-fold protein [Candidimonas sp.]|nr:alpha/beta hydrolase-fold protein [Candidimonas sp.]